MLIIQKEWHGEDDLALNNIYFFSFFSIEYSLYCVHDKTLKRMTFSFNSRRRMLIWGEELGIPFLV